MYRNDRGFSCLIPINALRESQDMCLADKEEADAEDSAQTKQREAE
jgi:hypothetical protein